MSLNEPNGMDTRPYLHSANSSRKRVLQVINNVDVGGAEKRLLDIARFADKRVDFHICLLAREVGCLADQFRDEGVSLHHVPFGPHFPLEFIRKVRQLGVDVVHAHMHFSAGLVMRLAAFAGVPTRVAHFRSCQDGKTNTLFRRFQRSILKSWIKKYATEVLACGETVMKKNWGPHWAEDSRFHVVHNGLDVSPFCIERDRQGVSTEFGIAPDSPLFIHVGNLRRPKNHPKLLSVFHQIVKQSPTANLILVGKGDNERVRSLKEYTQTQGFADRVHSAGLRNDVPRLLRAADAMIFPSLWEGLPGAVLEACAADIPVLASAIPEIQEIAVRFPNVRCLPLSLSDEQWALDALKMMNTHPRKQNNDKEIELFLRSPYGILNCVKSHYRAWGCETQTHRDEMRVA